MLGIAQVGFLYILEKCNFRFHTLGGASAGAITALLLAAIRKNPLDEASTAILKLLALNPFKSFKDRADSQNQKYADAFVDDIVKRLEPGKLVLINKTGAEKVCLELVPVHLAVICILKL